MTLRRLLAAGLFAFAATGAAQARISDGELRVGLMTDLSGTYRDVAGQGAVIAAEMAVEDFGGTVAGRPIRLVIADHQGKADVAAVLARRLHEEEGVDAYAELIGSGPALAVQRYAREHGLVTLHSGAETASLTSEECSPTGVHWTYDTVALARGTARALLEDGGDSWFFVTADNQFGRQLEADVRAVVEASGGTVVGEARHPVNGIYFSPYLLGSAQPSGAKVVALATSGSDAVTAIKEAYEFGVMQSGQQLAGLMLFISDVRQLSLYMVAGMKLTTGFYWDYDEATREWGRRFHQRAGFMPTMVQAGTYSALMHYFKAVDALGSDEGRTVVDRMKAMPVQDFFARNGAVRADGRMVHDMLLVEVKRASESAGAWDYYKVLRVIPGSQAFRPMEEGTCPYLR